MASIWKGIPRRTKLRSTKTPHGAALMALKDGGLTVAVITANIVQVLNSGERPFAMPWTGFVTNLLPFMKGRWYGMGVTLGRSETST